MCEDIVLTFYSLIESVLLVKGVLRLSQLSSQLLVSLFPCEGTITPETPVGGMVCCEVLTVTPWIHSGSPVR